jgi:hypothetical protein
MHTAPHQPNDWKLIAEQASQELDPQKFMTLINDLNCVLLEQEETTRSRRRESKPVLCGIAR